MLRQQFSRFRELQNHLQNLLELFAGLAPAGPCPSPSFCFGRAEVGQGICVSNKCLGGFKVPGTEL